MNGYIETYLIAFGLPLKNITKTTVVPVDGGCRSKPSASCGHEQAYDDETFTESREYLAALAPAAEVYLYEIPEPTYNAEIDGFNKVVADNDVAVAVSDWGTLSSYGEGWPNSQSFALALDHIIRQGDALGITFVAEGGFTTLSAGITIPADSPHELSVGDSRLFVSAKGDYASEYATGDEGAPSYFFAVPSYQQGIAGVSDFGRNVPDVSGAGTAGITGSTALPFVAYDGNWGVGPALQPNPAPVVASIIDLDEMSKTGRSGFINTTLYGLYRKHRYGPRNAPLFHDITTFYNSASSASEPCTPGVGFNSCAGIGSINGWNLIQALRSVK